MQPSDEGGEAACLAHLAEDASTPVVVDLASIADLGGAVWSLRRDAPDAELDVNLVRLEAGGAIVAHINSELDVLIVVQSGTATLVIDEASHTLRPGMLALVPKHASRAITAGDDGCGYLSIHLRRAPLTIFRR